MVDHPRFSDFSREEKRLEGTKMRIQEILNKEILITGYTVNQSQYSNGKSGSESYLALQFELDGERHIIFTGSSVLTDQITRYKENIPFYTTIKRIDRYYTFT